jgi:hypothetical protein
MTNTTNVPISTQIVRTKKKKKKSLKKDKLFNLLSMETLLEYVPHIKSKYEHLVRTSASLFGYHWNEVINTILYNKYVKNNPDVFRLYISIKNIVDIEKNRDKANKANSSLKEIMDPTKNYGFEEKDFDKSLTNTDNLILNRYKKNNYEIIFFYNKKNKDLKIDFSYNNSFMSTNKNEPFNIFKYISDILNGFINNNEVETIIYKLGETLGGQKRHRIYKNVLEKLNFSLVKINEGPPLNEYIYQKNEASSIKEIMDPTKDYGFKEKDFEKSSFNVDNDINDIYEKDGYKYYFDYNSYHKLLDISFEGEYDYDLTNKNEQYKVFKYVSDLLNNYINKYDIKFINYKVDDDKGGQKRHRIYKNILDKLNFKLNKTNNKGYFIEYRFKKDESSSLKEILDPTKDYGFEEKDFFKKIIKGDYDDTYNFKKDKYNIQIKHDKIHNTIFINFNYDEFYNLTNKNEQYKVFKYISDLINHFIETKNIEAIVYAVDDDKEGEKRHRIYKNVLEKLNFYPVIKFSNQYIYKKKSYPNELTETTTTASVFGGSGFPLMRGVFNMSKGQNMFDPKNKIVDKIKNKQINKDMSIVNVNAKQLQEKYLKNIDITNIGEVNNFLNENNFTIDEHHIESRKGKINFILSNSDEYTETDLTYCSDDEVTKIYTKIENGKFDNNKSDMDKQILDAETLMNEVEAMFMNEEAKHPFTKNIDKINKENSKNSKTYFKELNKGVQDMINRKADSTESIYFKHDYDKDSKELNVLRKAIDNTDNNTEYLETVHRGLEDLEPTYPNKKWEENSKKYMGDKLYNQGKKRREEKLRLNQPNTSPGRMNTDLPKPKINEASDVITFYYTNFNKKQFITESRDNIRQNKFIDKTNFIKLELVTPINESKAVNFNNEYYYNMETGKIYYELNKKPLTILKESSNKFNQLINLDNTSKYNSKKTINKKIK